MRSLILICIFLFTTAICCNAVSFSINNIQDLESFASIISQKDSQYDVTLNADIDISESSKPNLFAHPLGYNTQTGNKCYLFSGSFEGNGFTIKNLKMDNDKLDSGLFCGLKNVEIRNLVIGSSCSFKGDHSGSIAPRAYENVTLRNIINKASIIGGEFIGGLIGFVGNVKNSSIIIDSCINEGDIDGEQYTNNAVCGGIIGDLWVTENFNITIRNTTNNGSVRGRTFVGGFISNMEFNNDLVVNITNSINNGDCAHRLLESDSPVVGGAIGSIFHNNNCMIIIDSFTNNGSVTSRSSSFAAYSGGLIAYFQTNNGINLHIRNSINNGKILAVASPSPYVAGIICVIVESNNNSVVYLENNVNNGVFDCEDSSCYCGGIISLFKTNPGMEATLVNNTNNAPLYAKNVSVLGGIVGFVRDGPNKLVIDHGVNNGKLSADTVLNTIGGIVSYTDCVDYEGPMELVLKNCENKGKIESSSRGLCMGLVGVLKHSQVTVDVFNSINKGDVSCPNSYGIALVLRNAKNIVSIGSYATNPFWEESTGSCSDLFYKGTCSKCPSCAKSISLEGKYYVTDN